MFYQFYRLNECPYIICSPNTATEPHTETLFNQDTDNLPARLGQLVGPHPLHTLYTSALSKKEKKKLFNFQGEPPMEKCIFHLHLHLHLLFVFERFQLYLAFINITFMSHFRKRYFLVLVRKLPNSR